MESLPQFPFAYPTQPHCRKHGPDGYAAYSYYRDWLRDEFEFRCVFCLRRETWETLEGSWEIDHFRPQALRNDLALHYDNLVYACHRCNLLKGAKLLIDPCICAYGDHISVDDQGHIHGLTPEGRRMIRLLRLDSPSSRRYRWLKIRAARSFWVTDTVAYLVFMGYPEELPDIEGLDKTVPRNSRPQGVARSCLALRKRELLPATY